MNRITLTPPWLTLDLGSEMQVLSWSINRPGFVHSRRILWREVRNADLPPELDVDCWLKGELQLIDSEDAVTFLTSRSITQHVIRNVVLEECNVTAVATVGLSNAEHVGRRKNAIGNGFGTINIAVTMAPGVMQCALLEVLSIASEARTTAVIETGYKLPTGVATGTGTDCIAIAAPAGDIRFAGKHTAIGEAVGRAVYDAVRSGAEAWVDETRQ